MQSANWDSFSPSSFCSPQLLDNHSGTVSMWTSCIPEGEHLAQCVVQEITTINPAPRGPTSYREPKPLSNRNPIRLSAETQRWHFGRYHYFDLTVYVIYHKRRPLIRWAVCFSFEIYLYQSAFSENHWSAKLRAPFTWQESYQLCDEVSNLNKPISSRNCSLGPAAAFWLMMGHFFQNTDESRVYLKGQSVNNQCLSMNT